VSHARVPRPKSLDCPISFRLSELYEKVLEMTKTNLVSPDAAMARIPPGARIVASPGCGTPETLLRALGRCANQMARPTLYSGLQLGAYPFLQAVESEYLRYFTWHVYGAARLSHDAGQTQYVPARASAIPSLFHEWGINVALIRVSEPDAEGWCNLGPSASYPAVAVLQADVILAELDPALPRTFGDTKVHVDSIQAFVTSEEPTCTYVTADIDPIASAIAAHVLELIPPDPTLQLGLGSVPEMIAIAVANADIRIRKIVGMATDAMIDMLDKGVLGSGPNDFEPALAVVELMGSPRLMAAADRNPAIGVYASTTGHNPRHLSTYDRLVSVNSAVEVDFTGQVNAETVRGRQVSGIGGSVDFAEASHGSVGGISIVALPSATRDHTHSRIVPALDSGAAVTLARHMPDAIVTEYGVAWLRGRTLPERRESLIAVAHPDFRDILSNEKSPS
jgi:4-hydroxybutyrate CoA-transferase